MKRYILSVIWAIAAALSCSAQTTHTIQAGETLFRLTQIYGVTDAAIRAANPGLSATNFQIGQSVVIPASGNVATTSNSVKMGVLLPLKQGGIIGRHTREFYRGMLMAVDSIKHCGVNIDVYAFESGTSASDMRFVLQSHPELKEMDVIVGPLSTDQMQTLSDFSAENNIRLVVPFATQCAAVKTNPLMYTVSMQKEYLLNDLADIMSHVFTDQDVIIVHVEGEDADGQALVQRVKELYASRGQKVKELKLEASEEDMLATFNNLRPNLVLVAGNSMKVVNQLYSIIEGFAKGHPDYQFMVLGYPEWQNYTPSYLSQYYAYDTYLYSTFFRNPLNGATSTFEKKYMLWARQPMANTTPRFGLMGFDTAWYFLNGLSRYGDQLEEHLNDIKVTPFQHTMCFERACPGGGFVNRRVKLIHYKPSQSIDLLELK